MVDDVPTLGNDAPHPAWSTGLTMALDLVAAGYWVAPVRIHRRVDGKKSPDYLRIRWHDESTDDPDQVRSWYAEHGPDVSFLVDCGRSGAFVVDLDVPEVGPSGLDVWRDAGLNTGYGSVDEIPIGSPMVVKTPSGGFHLYYRQPAGRSLTVHKRIHGHPIDVRADGGHVYAPGAVVIADGADPRLHAGTYRYGDALVPAAELPELPPEVAAFLHATEGGPVRKATAQGEVRTRSTVVELCKAQLDRVEAMDRRPDSGFRSAVLGAGMVLGRAAAGGVFARPALEKRLERAVARVWGSANEDDRRWIRHGFEDGEADPWTVVPDDYDTTIPKMIMSTVNPASVNPVSDSASSAVGSLSTLSNGGTEVEPESAAAPVDGLAELEDVDSWEPVGRDAAMALLAGTVSAPEPAVGIVREDGHPFLYPGLEHALIGEMEAGKSWWALGCVAAELRAGRRVVYLHFEEADPTSTYLRLARQFRVPVEVILDRFVFAGPERRISVTDVDRILAGGAPSLVVLDGVNEAMALHGMGIFEADGAADFRRRLVKPWKRAGAAVLSLDHVAKSEEGRSSGYAYGAVGKGNGLDGAMLLLENVEAFGDGREGVSNVYVTKDRHGQLRKLGRLKESRTSAARMYYVGRMVINAQTPGAWRMEFRKPGAPDGGIDPEFEELRQAAAVGRVQAELDDRVFAAVADLDGKGIEISSRKVCAAVGGKTSKVLDALYRLEAAGRVKNQSAGQAARWVPAPPTVAP